MRLTKAMKKAFSLVLAGAMVITGANVGATKASAEGDSTVVYEGALPWNAGGNGDCRIQFANSWDGFVPEETKDITFTKAEVTFTVADFAKAGVEKADAIIEFNEPTWSITASEEPVTITGDGTYTVTGTLTAPAKLEQYMAVRIKDLDDKYEKNADGVSEGPLTFSDVKVVLYNEPASAELKALYEGALPWNAGGNGDCRIQFANSWDGFVPEETKDITFTKAEVTFTVADFAKAGVEKADAIIEFNEPTWSITASEEPVTITGDGTYTVTGTLTAPAKLEQYMAVRIKALDDKYEKNADGVSEGPLTFSDVKVVLYGEGTAAPDDPSTPDDPNTPEDPGTPEESVWTQEGHHAYVGYQMDGTWDYRNMYEEGKTHDDKTSYGYTQAGGADVSNEAEINDVLLEADGEYTVSIAGIDLSGSNFFNMLFVSTDIERAAYPDVQVTGATVKIDGKVVDGLENVAIPYQNADDNKFYTFAIATKYTDWKLTSEIKYWGEDNALEVVPTDSIEVTFTISGLGNKVENEPVGPAKGKQFTKGNFVYKVTKQAMTRTNGAVSVVGLSKAGKKAKSLSVANTVKSTGTYNVTAIGKNVFKGAAAASVTLNNKIKSIPVSAFVNCKKLTTLNLKAKLTSVKKGAFKGCTKKITVKGASKKANVKTLKKSGYKNFK